MAGGSAIRGSRVGAGPMGEDERGEPAARVSMTFYCANGHASQTNFAQDAPVPQDWDCPRCGWPAGLDEDNPPSQVKIEPYKTHLAYVKERRTEGDGGDLLDEALARYREDKI